ALRGEFIQIVFKIPPVVHALDVDCDSDKRPILELARIMDCVSQFMIYNAVLRAFVRGFAKVKDSERSEETLKAQYPLLWEGLGLN
ncbi:hypothetical protein V5O48_019017, partial [Marasmius crinis-equi]